MDRGGASGSQPAVEGLSQVLSVIVCRLGMYPTKSSESLSCGSIAWAASPPPPTP